MPITDVPLIQPHDLDAERAILGAIALDRSALAHAQEIISNRDFYDSRNRRVFEAMIELIDRQESIDLLTVGNRLEETGDLKLIGGRGDLAETLTCVASSSNVEQHCRIVRDHAIRRRLIKLTAEISRRAYNNDAVDGLLEDTERTLGEVTSGRDGRTWCSLAELTRETLDYVDHASKRGEALIGIPTGYEVLNTILGGWQRSDLVIIAARPSMGKTAFALGSAVAAAKTGARVGLISLEMSRKQLGIRLHGMEAPLDVHALRTGRLTHEGWWRLANTASQLEPLLLWIDDSSMLTVEQLTAKARQLHVKHGLDLLVVDYLQLLQVHNPERRQQGIADASQKLKQLAKELDVPVIVLSQLSRDCERREDKRPVLADLRESGAIEQDADVVLFLYRHEFYVPDTDEKGVAEVLIRKHRNGPVGDRRLKFVDRFARFEDEE